MTVSTTESRIGYNGNGATTVFAFPYRFLVNTDLVVTLVRADTTQVVQTLNTDYTVTGAGDDAGGTVTMVVPPATGQQLVIVRDVPLTQETDYISGDPFPAETHERALDKLTMISQRLNNLISRSIRLSDADLLVTSTILPAPSPGSSLIWNLTGTGLVNGVSSGSFVGLSPYMEVVLGSVDAAEALTNLTAAADASVVKLTGAQTVAGVKTFSDKPIIPDGTAAQNPVSKAQLDAAVAAIARGLVRQSVLSGPVGSSGLPAFGGSTGSTTVTASGTLIVTAANGWNASGALDRVGSITNPSWTGLSINGAMYLYLDIAANGACTPGSTTLAPIYQWGGVYSTTSGQNTYNIQEAVMQVGNGSTASQVYRVFVGEVTVSGGVVTAITWYALMGRYVSPDTSVPAANTPVNFSHNIGVTPNITAYIKNAVPELGFSVGDVVTVPRQDDGATLMEVVGSRLGATYISNQPSFALINKSTGGTRITFTAGNWRVFVKCDRGW